MLANLNRSSREARTNKPICRCTTVHQLIEASRFVAVYPTRRAGDLMVQQLTAETPSACQQIDPETWRKPREGQGSYSRRSTTRNSWASTISMGRNRRRGIVRSQRSRDVGTPSTRRHTHHARADATCDHELAQPVPSAYDRSASSTQPRLAQIRQGSAVSPEAHVTNT